MVGANAQVGWFVVCGPRCGRGLLKKIMKRVYFENIEHGVTFWDIDEKGYVFNYGPLSGPDWIGTHVIGVSHMQVGQKLKFTSKLSNHEFAQLKAKIIEINDLADPYIKNSDYPIKHQL